MADFLLLDSTDFLLLDSSGDRLLLEADVGVGFQSAWIYGTQSAVAHMQKNVASQVVAFQMASATDGSAVTSGTPTVYVTIDGGTQATGSGTSTHEGNGQWSYAATQAETNGDHLVFTMAISGAVSQGVNVYTSAPNFNALGIEADGDLTKVNTLDGHTAQTGDSFARIGANGAGLSDLATAAELAKVPKSDGAVSWNATALAAINAEADTALTDYDPPTKAELDSGLAALNDPTVGQIADQVWDEAIADHLGAGSTGASLNGAGSAGDPWTTALPGAYGAGTAGNILGNNLDAPVGTVDTVVDAIKAVTDNLPNGGALTDLATAAAVAALNDLSAADVNAEVLDVLNVDTFGEPSGVPGDTVSLTAKIGVLYAALLYGLDQTATKKSFKNSAGTAQWSKTVSDDGTTYTEGGAAAP